jgi:hypothetical protein
MSSKLNLKRMPKTIIKTKIKPKTKTTLTYIIKVWLKMNCLITELP